MKRRWIVTSTDVTQALAFPNTITKVSWENQAVDETGKVIARVIGTTVIPWDPDVPFVAFEDLEEEDMIAWVFRYTSEIAIWGIQQDLNSQLLDQSVKPPSVIAREEGRDFVTSEEKAEIKAEAERVRLQLQEAARNEAQLESERVERIRLEEDRLREEALKKLEEEVAALPPPMPIEPPPSPPTQGEPILNEEPSAPPPLPPADPTDGAPTQDGAVQEPPPLVVTPPSEPEPPQPEAIPTPPPEVTEATPADPVFDPDIQQAALDPTNTNTPQEAAVFSPDPAVPGPAEPPPPVETPIVEETPTLSPDQEAILREETVNVPVGEEVISTLTEVVEEVPNIQPEVLPEPEVLVEVGVPVADPGSETPVDPLPVEPVVEEVPSTEPPTLEVPVEPSQEADPPVVEGEVVVEEAPPPVNN